jgi:hypothetical protein
MFWHNADKSTEDEKKGKNKSTEHEKKVKNKEYTG